MKLSVSAMPHGLDNLCTIHDAANAVEPVTVGVDVAVMLHPVQRDGRNTDQALVLQASIKHCGAELAQIGGAVHLVSKALPGGMQGSGILGAKLGFILGGLIGAGLPVSDLPLLQTGLDAMPCIAEDQSRSIVQAVYVKIVWLRRLRGKTLE